VGCPTTLGVLRGQLPGAKGNSRTRKYETEMLFPIRKYETEMLFPIGKAITKRSISDGHGLNGRSST